MAFKTKAFLALTLLLAIPIVAFGRIRPIWTYAQMQEQSDLVIIAKPASSVSLEEKVSLPNISPVTAVVGIETKLEVRAVLKGDRSSKVVLLHHYALQNPADGQVRGASQLISFDTKRATCYLMFLKHEANGRYVPVTGQTDPASETIIKLESDAR